MKALAFRGFLVLASCSDLHRFPIRQPNNENTPITNLRAMEQGFYGSDLPLKLLEVKAMKIDPTHRVGEAALMKSRWFDYRDMHHVTATYLFAHFYKEQTAKFYEKVIDFRTVENARAFVPDDIFMSRDLTSMWLARRFADEHGLPYPFLIQFAQERCLARTQRHFPRPNQLYGEELEIDIMAAWKDQLARQLTYSRLPKFTMRNWQGRAEQAAHVRFVVAQIKQRQVPRHRLLARMLQEDILSLPLIAELFSQAEADQAEQYCAQFK